MGGRRKWTVAALAALCVLGVFAYLRLGVEQLPDIAQKLYYRDSDFRVVDALKALAAERELSRATLAYAWLLHKPGVSAPIIGASKPGQLGAAVAALDVALSGDEIARLEAAYEPHPVLGHQ